jgi:protoporphyrinogen oxidase
MTPKRIVIIGGGITGMTAALELVKTRLDIEVTVLENAPEVGGLARGFPICGTSLEKAYHYLFLTDSEILDLVQELGLEESVIWADSTIGIYLDGAVHPFTTPFDLLRFRPLQIWDRIRLGLVTVYLGRMHDWRALAKSSAHQWMRRACGRAAAEKVWIPLLKGKFDRYFDKISMAWLWARIHSRANSRSSMGVKEQLGYFKGGFATLTSRLEAELRRRNVRIRTGVRVEQISYDRHLTLTDGSIVPFDICIFTGSSPTLASLLPERPEMAEYRRKLTSIEYLGVVCLIFASDQEIGEQFWVNVQEEGAPFVVFIDHTRLVGTDSYQGKHIYYIGCYKPGDSSLFSLDDDALVQKWFSYLRKIYPHFDVKRVTERHVFKFKYAQHIVDTDYEKRIPDYRTPSPGVFLSNFSQIYPEDRGTNFSVREGRRVAELVIDGLQSPRS